MVSSHIVNAPLQTLYHCKVKVNVMEKDDTFMQSNDHKNLLKFLQNIHVSFLRTVPPYSHQADVWTELLKRFKYRQLVFMHSSDTDGRALLGRFQTNIQDLQAEEQEHKVPNT